MSNRLIDLAGQRFGRLQVLSRASSGKNGIARWECACDCGGETIVQGNHLRRGDISSCGCLQREAAAVAKRTHGCSGTSTHTVWLGMLQRCADHGVPCFKHYGGRGIVVDSRWLKFENFLADMGERPAGMTIERNDVNGPYAPSNCRWATRLEQANNTRRNHYLSAFGRTQTASQWGREIGVTGHTILKRIARGWTAERALAP